MTALLELDQVTFAYPGREVNALSDVSLAVQAGEVAALLGPNGAGKSTALRLAMALLHPATGEVRMLGRSTRGRMPEDLAGDAAFLFQRPEHQLFASTVEDDVAFGPRQLGLGNGPGVVQEVLTLLELADVAAVHPYDLPAPRRRLVALAGALALRPRILLLDEPTAGLDRHSRALVRQAVAAHRAAGGAALVVSHDGEFILEVADRALMLTQGRVAQEGEPAGLLGTGGAPDLPAWAQIAAALGAPSSEWRFQGAVGFVASRCRRREDA